MPEPRRRRFLSTIQKTSASLLALTCCLLSTAALYSQTGARETAPAAGGPTGVLVRSKFGGQIFGFDLDQNGTEGVLAEAKFLADGTVLAAVETFDQQSGRILKVVAQTQTQDDFITMGVVGNSIGLIQREHSLSTLHVIRQLKTMNPLSGNKFTGTWTPPIDTKHIVNLVSRSQGGDSVAAWAEDVSGNFIPMVFSSNVAENTFGPAIPVTDPDFTFADSPQIAYFSQANQAVLAHQKLSPFFEPPIMATVDLATGAFNKFTGVGLGIPNGLAMASDDGIAMTTTELDFSVQFYDLLNGFARNMPIPGATNQIQSATDVEYDPLHKLFFVAQPVSSVTPTGSTIHVYDLSDAYVKALNGFNFVDSRFNIEPVHIALNPAKRLGYVDGPDEGFTQLQQFRY